MSEKVLITGGCGFVGSNLVRRLIRSGYEISVLDNLSTGKARDLDLTGAELIQGDIRDRAVVADAVKGADSIVHLAADTRVMDSIDAPRVNFDVNVIGTFNLLEAARPEGVHRLVFASTGGAIIGEVVPPVHEDMVPRPISPYGASKLAGEAYASAFAGSYDLSVTALRFANVYGPFSYNKGSVIAKFFKDTLAGRPWTIYGDGSQTRDFVYVGDLTGAVEKALRLDRGGFRVFNIASGTETSIIALTEVIKEVSGCGNQPIQYQPARRGEIYRNFSLIDKARAELGFEPSTSLYEGLRATWKWFQEAEDEGVEP